MGVSAEENKDMGQGIIMGNISGTHTFTNSLLITCKLQILNRNFVYYFPLQNYTVTVAILMYMYVYHFIAILYYRQAIQLVPDIDKIVTSNNTKKEDEKEEVELSSCLSSISLTETELYYCHPNSPSKVYHI